MNDKDIRSADGAKSFDRAYVTSEEIYQQESQTIFSKSWVCVEHISQLGIDIVKPFEIDGHKLLVVADGSSYRVFRNFCRHRGSLLVSGRVCQTLGQRIQCPYHAWTYQRDGRLVAAPNMDAVDDFNPGEMGLIEVPCEVFGGFIWLNLAPESNVAEFLAPVEQQFRDYQISELRVVEEIEYEVRANWKLIFQNYSECYHCPSVHPILNRLTPFKGSSNELVSGPILGGPMQLSEDSETMSMDGKCVARILPGLSQEQARCVNYYTIFPTIFLSTHPDYVLIHRLERMSVDRTRVVCQFLFHPEAIQRPGFESNRAVEFWDLTNRQDWEVCELAQAGMEDIGYLPGPYSNLESVLAAFDRHYYDLMG